jgi:hemerythrin-like metal-binding protein
MPLPQLFAWQDDLLIHVDVIDGQHKEYFTRVNDALRQAAAGQSAEAMVQALDFVASYVVFHFDTEQDAMRFAEYPDTDSHIERHQHFAAQLDELRDTFMQRGFRSGLAQELNALLVDWFVHHIRSVDQALGRFLQGA